MENNLIRPNLRSLDEAAVQLPAQPLLFDVPKLVHVQDEFVQLHGVILQFPDLQLPGADVRSVVKYMLELVEINQGPFDLVELHRLDLGAPGDLSQQTGQDTAAVRAGSVDQAALDDVSGAVTKGHAATGFQRGEDQFARFSFRHDRARFWVDHFENPEVGIEMISGGRLIHGER